MTYMGAEQVLTDLWVKMSIQAEQAALEAIDTGLSLRVFQDFAPRGTPYPFIIWQCQDPPRDVRGVGVSRVMVDTLYLVKAVAQALSYDDLAPVAGVIDRAMTSSTGSAVEDGFVLTSVRERQFSMIEVENGTQYRHLGGEYKMQAQAEQ